MKKNMFTAFIIAVIIIVIIFYLIVNIKQEYVDCTINHNDELGIRYTEDVKSYFSSKSINKIEIERIIALPDKFNNKANIDAVMFSLKKSYKYLGEDVKITNVDNKIIMRISTSKNKPIILDNMKFYDSDSLGISINTNTKSSDVVNIKVGDKFSLGEYMVLMKNYGYSCK